MADCSVWATKLLVASAMGCHFALVSFLTATVFSFAAASSMIGFATQEVSKGSDKHAC
jgi:hypothetical protein